MENRAVLEEKLNSYTHGMGMLLSLIAVYLLLNSVSLLGDNLKLMSGVIYGVSLVALFSSSTIYHSITKQDLKQFFRKIDHSCIFIKIAGSYTPFALITLNGVFGWTLFSIVWLIALSGIVMKFLFIHKMEKLSLVLYLIMGWLSLTSIKQIAETISMEGTILLIAGGLFYSVGAIFYAMKKMPYSHPIWHLFVLAGSTCHFFSIMNYVLVV